MIATGRGLPAHPTFPPGLPSLYALLAVAGIGKSWAIVMLNIVFLVLAIASTIFIYRRALGIGRQVSVLLCCTALLSYVLVKFAPDALSDVPFLGVSSASLALLTFAPQDRSGRRFAALGLGLLLVGVAMAIRSAGVALIPPALVAIVEASRSGNPLRFWLRTRWAALSFACCAAACAALAFFLSGSRYFESAAAGGGGSALGSQLAEHIRNWGEIGLNVPVTRLPQALHLLLLPMGLLVLGVIVVGLWHGRHRAEPVHVFAVSYLVLILAWPFADARFWLPFIPLAIGYTYNALRNLLGRLAGAVVLGAYVSVFAAIGLAALVVTTRISFSGMDFPNRYGSGQAGVSSQAAYRVAFNEARPGDARLVSQSILDQELIRVLRLWEPLAKPHTAGS